MNKIVIAIKNYVYLYEIELDFNLKKKIVINSFGIIKVNITNTGCPNITALSLPINYLYDTLVFENNLNNEKEWRRFDYCIRVILKIINRMFRRSYSVITLFWLFVLKFTFTIKCFSLLIWILMCSYVIIDFTGAYKFLI